MARGSITPADLAHRLGIEVDDVLLMLWDAGIEYPRSPLSPIRARDSRDAERACGLAEPRERLVVAYWQNLLKQTPDEFADYAADLGIRIGPQTRRLPKGALAKLERATRKHAPALSSKPQPAAKPPRQFVWQERGNRRDDMVFLSAREIEEIHMSIALDFADSPDPISPAGVRDLALLESASARPSTGLGEYRKYPTVQMAAAALMHSIVHNHAFFNGNKRTGLVSMLSFLDAHDFTLMTTQDELFKWTIRVASHRLNPDNFIGDINDIEVQSMTDWLVQKSRQVDHTNRMINSGPLQKRLVVLGCEVQKSGTKLRIRRMVPTESSRWGKPKFVALNFSIPFMGDGRQVSRAQLRELRRTLRFTEDDGYDSTAFFGADKTPTDEFISRYRKTLKRLAKV
jgi:death-on-curing family protein